MTESSKLSESSIVYVAKLHWLLFLGPLILGGVALWLGTQVVMLQQISLFFIVFSLFWLLVTWVNYHFSSLTIEKKRVIFRTGILVRKTTDIPFTKIESIDIRQSIIGSIMQYGSLTITGTGGTRHFINFLTRPLTCRRYIEQLMHEQDL